MRNQFIRIGYSADWDLEYHTMDDWYKAAVQKSLIEFYKKGMLYQAEHPVYWCPRCRTSLAKAEVGYVEEDGFLYYIKLPLADGSGHVPIATTRPELMPACVAVFVHPEDERYKHVVGKKVKLPIFEREVPVLATRTLTRALELVLSTTVPTATSRTSSGRSATTFRSS